MAKRHTSAVTKAEQRKLARLAALSADVKARKIRELERKLLLANDRITELRGLHRHAERDLARTQTAMDRLEAMKGRISIQRYENSRKRRGRGKATAIVCVTDWHFEECVDPDVVNGLNEYNPDIAARRVGVVWEKALHLLDVARSQSNITELVLWAGGDMINGFIHEEMQESNTKGPAEASLLVQDHLATGLKLLKEKSGIKSLVFLANCGNHGRTTKRKRHATDWRSSWEWLTYQTLAKYFANETDTHFKIAKGYHLWFPVQGYPIRFHHGDAIKYNGGVGGVHGPLRKKISLWNKTGKAAALDILGHFHQYSEDWNYVLCGSLVGYNAFALQHSFEPQPPTQTMIVIDHDRGKVFCEPIFCEVDSPIRMPQIA